MSTIKFDRMAVDFVSRIPDQFQTAFIPGEKPLPDGYNITAEIIINYINRALQELFGMYWNALVAERKDLRSFLRVFPELNRFSDAITFTNGIYTIASPYLDFHKLIGAMSDAGTFIKVWDEDKYTIALSSEYPQYTPTEDKPAIIQMGKSLNLFPLASTAQNYTTTIEVNADFNNTTKQVYIAYADHTPVQADVGKIIALWVTTPGDHAVLTKIASVIDEHNFTVEDELGFTGSGVSYAIFSNNNFSTAIKIQYIQFPVDPETGDFLLQDGDYDSPFSPIWSKRIVDIAEEMFLRDSFQTN